MYIKAIIKVRLLKNAYSLCAFDNTMLKIVKQACFLQKFFTVTLNWQCRTLDCLAGCYWNANISCRMDFLSGHPCLNTKNSMRVVTQKGATVMKYRTGTTTPVHSKHIALLLVNKKLTSNTSESETHSCTTDCSVPLMRMLGYLGTAHYSFREKTARKLCNTLSARTWILEQLFEHYGTCKGVKGQKLQG